MVVEELDARAGGIVEQVNAVRQAAYSREAALLGVKDFPPLRVGVEELRDSRSRLFGVRKAGKVVAVLELEFEAETLCISTLVVSPNDQGKGMGGALLEAAIAAASGEPLEVQTGLRNERAVRLYLKRGFRQVKVWRLVSGLELVRLRHQGRNGATAA